MNGGGKEHCNKDKTVKNTRFHVEMAQDIMNRLGGGTVMPPDMQGVHEVDVQMIQVIGKVSTVIRKK